MAEKEFDFRSIELNGKTIGLIGCGRIGRKMAGFAKGFKMKVIAYDPYKSLEDAGLEQVEMEELLKRADIVSVHVALNDQTRKMINKSIFGKMKDGVYFINTSRGDVVSEEALIEALQSGKVKAAGVDVISGEDLIDKYNLPLIKYSREHSNLIVTPHIAGATVESEYKAAKFIVDKIIGSLKVSCKQGV